MQFKEITHSSRPRTPGGPFALITFEISDTIFLVERVYPNLIQFLSDFGGLAQVCSFIAFSVIVIHHNIIIDQYLLNDAILQKDQGRQEEEFRTLKSADQQENQIDTRSFSYLEVFKFQYCCRKDGERAKRYKELMKIVAERMDIANIVRNNSNLNVMSNVILEPYQMKLVSRYLVRKQQNLTQISIQEAIG